MLVGQRLSAEVFAEPAAMFPNKKVKWTLPDNDIVDGYSTTLTTGDSAPVPAAEKASSAVDFNWINGSFNGALKKVTAHVTSSAASRGAQVVFKVYRPRVDQFTSTKTSAVPWINQVGVYIVFGLANDQGVKIDGKATMPAVGGGDVSIFQMIDFKYSFTKDDGHNTKTKKSSNGSYVLDSAPDQTDAPYQNLISTANASAQASIHVDDVPGFAKQAVNKFTGLNARFEDYLMFKPDGADSIWVSLRKNTWNVTFSASKDALGAWTIDNPKSPVNVPPNGKETTQLPEWQTHSRAILNAAEVPD
jgi:hypothetical protein